MRYTTAGESHGLCLTAIVDDVPAGLHISEASINADLARRQAGYGRSSRHKVKDSVTILSGVRFGRTTGAPVSFMIRNGEQETWAPVMAPQGDRPDSAKRLTAPRPGHADLVGMQKVNGDDVRDVLERASARETAARVAASSIARELLADLEIDIVSYVVQIGGVSMPEDDPIAQAKSYTQLDIETSQVRCPDQQTSEAMMAEIDRARDEGQSLGGTFRVVVTGLMPGLGDYAQGRERLTSLLGGALFSIPAIKGVEFGLGFEAAHRDGSAVHDPIVLEEEGFGRASNNAGGLEGGMTTGQALVVTCAMKPIPTMTSPLPTVDIDSLEAVDATYERSDICAVPAAAVVAESEVAFVLADAICRKFGADDIDAIKQAVRQYKQRLRSFIR